MRNIPIPKNEIERLAAVRRYNILDTNEEQDFDDIVELATQICDAPVAIITLIDKNRQWFKSKIGLNFRETDRNLAFCAYAILQDNIMIVNDTHYDKRFKNHPLVTGDPHLRFYAGVPLVTDDDQKLGTLAVLDRKPRNLSADQKRALEILAHQVIVLLDLRLSLIKLKESAFQDAYLATLVEQSLDAIISVDRHQRIKSWNAASRDLLGYTEKEAVNSMLSNILPGNATINGNEAAVENVDLKKVIDKRKMWRGELTCLHKKGHHIFTLASFSPVLGIGNELTHYVLQLTDISERKKLEDKLKKINVNLKDRIREKTSQIREIFERVSDAFMALDKDWNCTYVNKRAEEIFRKPGEKIVGKNFWHVFPEAQKSDFETAAIEAMKSQDYQNKEVFYEPLGLWFEHHIYPSATGLSIYFRDITEKKKAEEELGHHLVELQKTNFELDRFVYSVSHDLRAPLASILGLVNIAEYEKSTSPPKVYLDMIRKSVIRLDGFIKDILDYSRNSRIDVKAEKIDFSQLLEEIQNSLLSQEGAEKIKIFTNIKNQNHFYSDTTRISVILENLLSNAVKYRDEEKEASFLQINITATENDAVIEFKDNGIGIESHHLNNIFDMFYRASDKSKGSGLGLYIVKETVSKLGGRIDVSSEPDKYTQFEVRIPNYSSR